MGYDEKLQLLRTAVAAKARYWDAVTSLENALLNSEEPTDLQSDQLTQGIENLAVGLDKPDDVYAYIGVEELEALCQNLGVSIAAPCPVEQAPA